MLIQTYEGKTITEWALQVKAMQGTLAEKDARIKELEDWQRIVCGTGNDREAVIRMAAAEYTKTAVQCWKDYTAKLLGEAVLFAKNVQRNGRWQENEWNFAVAFLARHDVREWQERQKEGA